MEQTWDVTLTRISAGGTIAVALPAGLSRALSAAGFTRAQVRVTEKGVLLVPYVGVAAPGPKMQPTVELPEWSS